MKAFIVRMLRVLLSKLETPAHYAARTRELVVWAEETYPNFRGERKHHQVINRLVDEFPAVRRKDLCFEIEKVLQEIR